MGTISDECSSSCSCSSSAWLWRPSAWMTRKPYAVVISFLLRNVFYLRTELNGTWHRPATFRQLARWMSLAHIERPLCRWVEKLTIRPVTVSISRTQREIHSPILQRVNHQFEQSICGMYAYTYTNIILNRLQNNVLWALEGPCFSSVDSAAHTASPRVSSAKCTWHSVLSSSAANVSETTVTFSPLTVQSA